LLNALARVADGISHANTGEQRALCSGGINNRQAQRIVTDNLGETASDADARVADQKGK
jgi:hypothetical protein